MTRTSFSGRNSSSPRHRPRYCVTFRSGGSPASGVAAFATLDASASPRGTGSDLSRPARMLPTTPQTIPSSRTMPASVRPRIRVATSRPGRKHPPIRDSRVQRGSSSPGGGSQTVGLRTTLRQFQQRLGIVRRIAAAEDEVVAEALRETGAPRGSGARPPGCHHQPMAATRRRAQTQASRRATCAAYVNQDPAQLRFAPGLQQVERNDNHRPPQPQNHRHRNPVRNQHRRERRHAGQSRRPAPRSPAIDRNTRDRSAALPPPDARARGFADAGSSPARRPPSRPTTQTPPQRAAIQSPADLVLRHRLSPSLGHHRFGPALALAETGVATALRRVGRDAVGSSPVPEATVPGGSLPGEPDSAGCHCGPTTGDEARKETRYHVRAGRAKSVPGWPAARTRPTTATA